MSEERYISDYLDDIRNALKEVAEFIEGMTFDDFVADKKTSNAVIRSLEVELVPKLQLGNPYPGSSSFHFAIASHHAVCCKRNKNAHGRFAQGAF
ncbi:MAG: hypothetical protein C4519_25120 [Desulfobacteraceae bacterium]|nr:MAG: hypothetical protein C4519_25120 [Desulfobacteraceae bacterium]